MFSKEMLSCVLSYHGSTFWRQKNLSPYRRHSTKQISSTAHQGHCRFDRTLFIYKTHLYKSLFHPSPPWQGRLLTPSAWSQAVGRGRMPSLLQATLPAHLILHLSRKRRIHQWYPTLTAAVHKGSETKIKQVTYLELVRVCWLRRGFIHLPDGPFGIRWLRSHQRTPAAAAGSHRASACAWRREGRGSWAQTSRRGGRTGSGTAWDAASAKACATRALVTG